MLQIMHLCPLIFGREISTLSPGEVCITVRPWKVRQTSSSPTRFFRGAKSLAKLTKPSGGVKFTPKPSAEFSCLTDWAIGSWNRIRQGAGHERGTDGTGMDLRDKWRPVTRSSSPRLVHLKNECLLGKKKHLKKPTWSFGGVGKSYTSGVFFGGSKLLTTDGCQGKHLTVGILHLKPRLCLEHGGMILPWNRSSYPVFLTCLENHHV